MLERIAVCCVGFILIVLVALLGYVVYDEFVSDKFYLRKDQWKCVETKIQLVPMYQPALKITTLVPQTVCVDYKKK